MLTVKQLAKLSGITPRTLHYYDSIGLLKPTQVGENGYRYYDKDALLRLQQILLYRELDLPLEEIKAIITRKDFNILAALESHRTELLQRIAKLERLVNTVDDTILHIKGVKEMSNQQLFGGLSDKQQAEYEKEAMQQYDPETVQASNRKWKNYTPEEKQRILDEGNAIYRDLVNAMPEGAASPDVQACVERWRQHLSYFWTPDESQLMGLAELYNEDPRFKANFDKFHPDLAAFMREAVSIYVRNQEK